MHQSSNMAFRQNLFLLIMFGFLSTALAKEKSCGNKLRHMADCQKYFLACTVEKSVPSTSCCDCYEQYTDMTSVYNQFVGNCSEQYLNKNHLNVIYNTQKTLVEMWNIAFCDDCFENGYPSNSTETFKNFETDFDTCLQKYNKTACQKCPNEYISLNEFYKKMDDQKSGKICFDIQDKMNATRLLWSKELKCCHREFSITLFLVGSSIFGVLPVLFYFGMYAYTKRLEGNHEVIDSAFNSENQEAAPSTSGGVSSGPLAANVLNDPSTSTSTVAPENITDIKKEQVNIDAEVQPESTPNPTNTNTNSLISF